MDNPFDLVVIGAGSGGLAAAKRAASYGAGWRSWRVTASVAPA